MCNGGLNSSVLKIVAYSHVTLALQNCPRTNPTVLQGCKVLSLFSQKLAGFVLGWGPFNNHRINTDFLEVATGFIRNDPVLRWDFLLIRLSFITKSVELNELRLLDLCSGCDATV